MESPFPPELYEAVGRFVTEYAQIEVNLQLSFWAYSGLDYETARAIIGGQRMADVIDRLKRVIRARNLDRRILSDIESIIPRINKLSEFRDKIMHRSWRASELGFAVTNIPGHKSGDALKAE